MKKSALIIAIAFVFCVSLGIPAFGMDHGKKMDHSEHGHGGGMDHGKHAGDLIHESTVDGHQFAYHLIDMRAKTKDMPEMKATHHLMVYVKGPDGKAVDKAKAGYMLEGPGDAKQRVMAMAMGGGFGADIDLSAKGSYTMKTKVIAGEKILMDKFVYEMK